MTRRPCITSISNERLKAVRRLADVRRRARSAVFVIEGHRQLRCALEAGADVREVLAAPELFLGPGDEALVSLAESRGARVVELARAAFVSISRGIRPDGLAAVVGRWPTELARLRLHRDPLLLVAGGIERPGNVGAIVRTACAAGADALVSADPRTDVFHPDAVRGSVGAIFHLPLAQATTVETIAWLGERDVRVVVATPDADLPHRRARLDGPVALVVGGERYGVATAWRDAAAETVAIPMPGPADSLNVAVAAGVVLFEAVRWRSARPETATLHE